MRREIILLYSFLAYGFALRRAVEAHFGAIGSAIIATFLILWGGAVLFDRLKRYDDRLNTPVVP